MPLMFLFCVRNDDEKFVSRLYADLTNARDDLRFNRVSNSLRQLILHLEIRDAIGARDRELLRVTSGGNT